METRYVIEITGKVQSVSFCYYYWQHAEELGLSNFAKNQPSGTVVIEIGGIESKLKEFVNLCLRGSPEANVKYITVQVADPDLYQGFKIL
jgi:acylphosphatase